MIEISKELLSEVLKENIIDVYKIGSNPNFKQNTLLFKLYGCGELCNINIYELAHKCKEWAYTKGYSICSYKFSNEASYSYLDLEMRNVFPCNEGFIFNGGFKNEFEADTEVESIFKACELIFNNKKGN